ncbi:dynamin family protein [Pectobacterium brasiliense]|uniref:dynamin family protein n=1 Tax=Pectobacterium brasiliense TaxID=180957 RepID=UPI0015DFF144|nr:dynamin family protein [Pectobacterium brasiliense]MBA0217818.1 dynamin family protein [Pectobacterium brasiliense]MBN3073858.1 dynamin family protein [Pectobacterium brasiliense]MBN3169281.1 dynamin family protein [Pectobacterium brasiliense]
MAGIKRNRAKSPVKAFSASQHCSVIVTATMSAGKTSLINALLGDDLLFSANEAATATLTRIIPNRNLRQRVEGASYTVYGELHAQSDNVYSELLRQWNDHQAVSSINLGCRIAGLRKTVRPLAIYDTPGPNNSQDMSHKILLNTALALPGKKLLVYVLNATQLATRDDECLLQEIKQNVNLTTNDSIIFILNKVDELDEEHGESIELFLNKSRDYLERIGFRQPIIIPAMMQMSLIARKILNRKPVTRTQHRRLQTELQRFHQNKHLFNLASNIPAVIKRQIYAELNRTKPEHAEFGIFNKTELNQFIAYSGIRTLELYISQHN